MKKKLNILYMPGYRYPASLDEPLTSGDLRYSFTLSRALARAGHQVTVITRREGDDAAEAELDGVKIYRYKSELQRIFSTSFDISWRRLRIFRRLYKQADVVICNSPLSLEHVLPIKAPIIYIASGLEDVKNYSLTPKEIAGFIAIRCLRDPMKRATWRKARLVNTTAWHEDDTLLKWGVPASKIGTISSGIDETRFQPQPTEGAKVRRKLGLRPADEVILSVSRFTPAKGVVETIQAFDMLARPHAKLVIAGVHHSHDDTYFAKITKAIAVAKHSSNIILLENVAEHALPAYYSMADVTSVFSKGYDPLPTVIVESMACGTPVVSTYYHTRKQFIEDGQTGLFVEERNLSDWVEKMTLLLDNKSLRADLAKRARAYVRQHFESAAIAKQYIRKIEK